MKKQFLTAFIILLSCYAQAQNALQSPQQFLGYAVGERFTPSHQVYRYAEHVAAQLPNKVKIVNYGQTYEKRQLLFVVVSAEENIKNLEQIRTDHLKSIGMMAGSPSTKDSKPIVWLSYNVHGNEGVSSEAFMKVLDELVQPNNATSAKILKNSIVILAPCLNPDGHGNTTNPGQVADTHTICLTQTVIGLGKHKKLRASS
jgi:murein tripeptide amidase MpaA